MKSFFILSIWIYDFHLSSCHEEYFALKERLTFSWSSKRNKLYFWRFLHKQIQNLKIFAYYCRKIVPTRILEISIGDFALEMR